MSKPANKTVIGMFMVGAIALSIIAVLILGSGKFFKKTFETVCYFEGSVGGLSIGAPVVFRGVKIGTVKEIVLRFDTKALLFIIPVYLEIDPGKMEPIGPVPKQLGQNLKVFIERGLRARLDMQSFVTGQLQVSLDFYPDKPAKLAQYQIDSKTPEIPTIPTPMQELSKKLEKIPFDQIFDKLNSALDGVDKLVHSPEIPAAIHSVKLTADGASKLVGNVDGQIAPLVTNVNGAVKDVRGLIENTDTRIGSLTARLEETIKGVGGNVQNVENKLGETLKGIGGNVQNVENKLGETLQDIRKGVHGIEKNIDTLTASLDETVKAAGGVIRNIDGQVAPFMTDLHKTVKTMDATLIAAQKAIDNIQGTVGENSAIAYQLNKTLEEVRGLARSIRVLSEYLERHPESLIRGK